MIDETLVLAWRQRALARDARDAAFRRELRDQLDGVVRVLVGRFGATRVLLFGSLARGEARVDSDVDLMVEGIVPSALGDAHVAALDALPGVWIDLVPAANARTEIRERAEREGIVLHAH